MAHDVRADRGLQRSTWQRKAAFWVGGAIAVVVLWLIGAAVIPRWWAQRVADVVDGRLTVGGLYGFFLGFVFTLVPLVALWIAIGRRSERRTWKGWLGWLVVAIVLAAPNLMTLGVVLGRRSAAHAGERILDVQGPGFRMWSLIGAIAAGVAVVALMYLVRTRGWFRDQNRRLRNDAASRQD